MREETIQRGMRRAGIAITCAVWLCAAAAAQEATPAAQPTQISALPSGAPRPATGVARRPTNVEPGSPEAKMFSNIDAPIVTTPQSEEAAGKSNDGSVKIHGHWVIELKEKDGTVKDRREFDNSYVGGYIMGLYLAGFDVPADPAIFFYSATNGTASLCNGLDNIVGNNIPNNSCGIFTSLTAGHGAVDANLGYCALAGSCYGGLTDTLSISGATGQFVLAATITPVTAGTFDTVQTNISGCYTAGFNSPVTISPSACYANAVSYSNATTTPPFLFNNSFTATTMSSSMTVKAGDVLVFTVTITFA